MPRVVWLPNVLPLQVSVLDPRRWWASRYALSLCSPSGLSRYIPQDILSLNPQPEPNLKEGGLFLHFPSSLSESSESLVQKINEFLAQGRVVSHFPSLRYRSIEALLVRGSPWVDDLWAKAPSRRLKIEFSDGPDVSIEDLYKAFRPFGLILDIRAPPSQPTDAPHFILVDFVTKRDAANARACLHGQEFTQENKKSTRIGIMYENMAPGATSWAWLTSHPRIAIPLLLVLIAGLSYAVFDPLRVANVENEITGGFSLRKSYGRLLAWYDSKWRRVRASIASSIGTTAKGKKTNQVNLISWDERVQDLLKLSATVQSVPETPILISGPVGSGKAELVSEATQEKPYRLRIDCSAIVSESGYASVGALAEQVNYYPSFVSLASFSNLIDGLLSAATGAKVGQTANDSIPGLSSSVESFLRKILDTVSVALSDIVALEEKKRDRDAETGSDIATVNYPVIVIDSFLSLNNAQAQTFYKVIMEWAATVTDQRLAHVIFVSSQPSADKHLTRVLTRPIDTYVLEDATPGNAMAYLSQNLETLNVSPKDLQVCVQQIGGRLTDLEMLLQKVLAGRTPLDSLADIVGRSVAELSKVGFGKDGAPESAWSAIQFWRLLQLLSKTEEVSFDALRFDPIFKGDPKALLAMERSGLITIFRDQEREVSVRPGKPIFRAAFKSILADQKLATTMGIDTCKQFIAEEEKKLGVYGSELQSLSTVMDNLSSPSLFVFLFGNWSLASSPVGLRVRQLSQEIRTSSVKLDNWNRELTRLKKSLRLTD